MIKGKTASVVAKEAGIHPFVVQKMSSLASRLPETALQKLVDSTAQLDEDLKSRGYDPWMQIRTFLQALS